MSGPATVVVDVHPSPGAVRASRRSIENFLDGCVRAGLCDSAPVAPEDLVLFGAQVIDDETGHKALLAAAKLALRYLDHPDVQAIPFARPAVLAALVVAAAIFKAEGRA